MTDYLLMAIAGTVILVVAVLVWLLREHKKLKHNYRLLAEQLQRNKEDVAGLCAAAVVVDQHLIDNDERVNAIWESINVHKSTQQLANPQPFSSPSRDDQSQGYDEAILKIRRGASIDELVRDCGLTRDEAVLLVRLHGR
ncbi:MAG: DUF2802 domain-containing protein [Methylomonas sp.]